jgi:transposase
MSYNAEWIRAWLSRRNIEPVIPRWGKERPPDEPFDREAYRRRNIIERCIGWLKECRRIMTRFEKLALSFLAFLRLAILQRLLRSHFSDGA